MKIRWYAEPQAHDYPAALSYLTLAMEEAVAKDVVVRLEKAEMTNFAAKDIFRASELSLLGVSNSHVEKDRALIQEKKKLSPVLLYRDPGSMRVIIADGYHRLCAVFSFDEDARIPCKIV